MYADDAAIFLSPHTQYLANLTTLLHNFGEVTGLFTKVSNSSIAPIRCYEIDMRAILNNFPAKIAAFPIKYLGIPLLGWIFNHMWTKWLLGSTLGSAR